MPSPKPRKRKTTPTPLDTKQRALLEKEEAIRAQQQRLKEFVQKAPELKKQAQERRREELITRASAGSRRIDAPTLLDRRYDLALTATGTHPRRKTLKSEQRQARLTFFGLLIALMLLSFWVWSIWR